MRRWVIGTRLHELPRFALPNGGGETTSCKIDNSNRCTDYKVVVGFCSRRPMAGLYRLPGIGFTEES